MENQNEAFSLPELKGRNRKDKQKLKVIIIISAVIIIILAVIIILLLSKKNNQDNSIIGADEISKNYSSGIEGKLEAIIFNLHDGIRLPDSIKYTVNNTIYTERGNKYVCDFNKLQQMLMKKGAITSINLESRTYKDKDVTSWIYRVFYKGTTSEPIYAEYMMDIFESNGVININSLELIAGNIPDALSIDTSKKEAPVIDTAAIRKRAEELKKADSLAAAKRRDSIMNLKKDTLKMNDTTSINIKKKKYGTDEKEKPALPDSSHK